MSSVVSSSFLFWPPLDISRNLACGDFNAAGRAATTFSMLDASKNNFFSFAFSHRENAEKNNVLPEPREMPNLVHSYSIAKPKTFNAFSVSLVSSTAFLA